MNQTLRMVQAEINTSELGRWMGSRGLTDLDHAFHCFQKDVLGELAPRPFRLIIPRKSSQGVMYAYTHAREEELQEAIATFGTPDQLRAMPPLGIRTKDMPSIWRPGRELGFEIRIRPIVRKNLRKENRATELDAYNLAVRETPEGETKPMRRETYAKWLEHQLEKQGGATMNPGIALMVSFQKIRSHRGNGNTVLGPETVMRSIMTIRNPEKFQQMLEHGIGRQRAYGYGMILLKPQRR